MREAVLRLIDDQKSRLLSREAETEVADPPPAPRLSPQEPVGPAPLSAEAEGDSRPKRATTAPGPAPREAPAVVVSTAPAMPATGTDAGTADPTPGVRPEDARQRLDALARLLDKRLKQAAGPAAEPASKAGED
jgi:hypothetical protein